MVEFFKFLPVLFQYFLIPVILLVTEKFFKVTFAKKAAFLHALLILDILMLHFFSCKDRVTALLFFLNETY